MISKALKAGAYDLDYMSRGIFPDDIDTHSLRAGGANALSLNGYTDREIQKMGRWRGETFKEYIREGLSSFSEGMSRAMKRNFQFVNVQSGVDSDVVDRTPDLLKAPYERSQ